MTKTVLTIGSSLACLMLAACGGGGGGGTGTATPSPPAPTTPQPLSLLGPSTSVQVQGALPTNAHFNVTAGPARGSGEDVEVTITDPDVLSPTRFDQINFDGDETIRIRQTSTGYDQTFPASQFQPGFGGSPRALFADTAGRSITYSQWGTGDPDGFQNIFRVYRLNKGAYADRTGPNDPQAPSNPTTYVALTEAGRVNGDHTNLGGVFQTIGVQTAAADMPLTGTLHFDGQATGYVYSGGSAIGDPNVYSGSGARFIARATIDVDLTRTSNNLTGAITTPSFLQFRGITQTPFTITFAGTTQGATFTATATGTWHGSPLSGTASGAFYGPSTAPATEVGGVFAVAGTPGSGTRGDLAIGGYYAEGDRIVGGFVAGR